MILIDPFLYPGGQVENFVQMRRRLVDRAHERRDVWRDRNEAYEFLRKKGEWDDRVMQLYVVSVQFDWECSMSAKVNGHLEIRSERTSARKSYLGAV